jgi:hypothetical protein
MGGYTFAVLATRQVGALFGRRTHKADTGFRHWAALGALVTVGTIAFDPFLQAVISTYGQLDSIPTNSNVTIGQSHRMHIGYIQSKGPTNAVNITGGILLIKPSVRGKPDFGFISSIYNGFQNTSTFRNDAIGAVCSTGNCTWPLYTSAALCSACEDISSQFKRLEVFGKNGSNVPSYLNGYERHFVKFELPYANIRNYVGFVDELDESDEVQEKTPGLPPPPRTHMTVNTTVEPNRTVSFQHMETLLMAFTVIRAPREWLDSQIKWEDAKPTATECALYLCANAYESKSEDNIMKERILGSWANKVPGSYGIDPNPWNAASANSVGWVKILGSNLYDPWVKRTDLQLVIPPSESEHLPQSVRREFNVSHTFIYSVIDYLLEYTKGELASLYMSSALGREGPPDESLNMLSYPSQALDMPAILDVLWDSTNLTITFDNVARSVTNYIRNSSKDRRHQGELKKWVLHTHVNWAYLTYPIAMLVAGIAYTILTILESTRLHMPVWKESALPTLLHGFDNDTQILLRDDQPAAKRKILVRFEEDEKDCMRLVSQQ